MNYLDLMLLCIISRVFQFTEVSTQNKLHVGLSISAKDRKVEVSWRNAPANKGDLILLFDEYPSELEAGNTNKSLRKIKPEKKSGWKTTDVSYSSSKKYNISTATGECHAFWIAYINEDKKILNRHCFRTYPNWMSRRKALIGNFRISQLFIPGTHDSGSYIDKKKDFVEKYTITQDEDIREQLIYGIRYLDIRVGHYKGEFWLNHGLFKIRPLQYVLEQIIDFVEHTNEIVIVDVQEFPVGFDKNDSEEIHRKLLHFIIKYLGDQMARTSLTWSATLNDIWKQRRRIILSYDNEKIVQGIGSEVVFQCVKQQWGDVKDLESLRKYLLKSLSEGGNIRPVAAMAELTPSAWDIILDKFGGLRNMADMVNQHVTNWYFDDWGNKANIVALDFFRGTDIVEAALYWNGIRCSP